MFLTWLHVLRGTQAARLKSNPLSPTLCPTLCPTLYPTFYPTLYPTLYPPLYLTLCPTLCPTLYPALCPTSTPPSAPPSAPPSTPPSTLPSPPGQVKQISGRACATLSKVMVALAERVSDTDPDELDRISALALELGVRLRPGSPKEGPAATAMWLFDGSVTELPGGFDVGELSPNSPVKVLQSFPQDLVFVGRSTVLIKGIAARLGITWSLAQQWSPIASQVLARNSGKLAKRERRVRFGAVAALFAQWAASKVEALLIGLPAPIRRLVAAAAFRLQGGTRKAA